ncbi:MAG: hypothetical protein K5769_08690 [Pseudobutyrivibrio sp.]|nr:hypothetical protein [Pseudobutyrivibrio sp.]
MRPRRKNKTIEFFLSFIPGAAEMYMGFMKNGLSIMCTAAIFFLIARVSILMTAFLIVWFFAFFHARNMAHLSEEELGQIEDRYFYEEFTDGRKIVMTKKLKKIIGAIIIVAGVSMIWGTVVQCLARLIPDEYWVGFYSTVRAIPEFILFILFIVLGVHLIRGKKDDLDKYDELEDNEYEP